MPTHGTPQGARKPKVMPLLPPAPALPEYLTIPKLSPQRIQNLPVNQQLLAEHLMKFRKGDQKSRRFLSQWAKRLAPGKEKETLQQILGESTGGQQ